MAFLYCLLRRKAKEVLDHLLWDCQDARVVWSCFLQEFDVWIAGLRYLHAMIGEFLLHLPSVTKANFSGSLGVCCFMGYLWGDEQWRVQREGYGPSLGFTCHFGLFVNL